MDTFRVRLNCIDHYQGSPTPLDPKVPDNVNSELEDVSPKVPVIRVFGATETGQKVCAHIHGALPYLYIQYFESLIPEEVYSYIHQLHLSIDHALAISYRRNPHNDKSVFVGHISLVKGVPFYGYHVGYEFYLKIYMLNPLNMTRLADLLRQGAIMKRPIQPYEGHMQYLAQWMCDYNLHGCAYIECRQPKFRNPVPEFLLEDEAQKWHDRTVQLTDILDEDIYPRQSHCSIEVDVRVADILNRGDVKQRPIHHDFMEINKPLPEGEKLVQSMAGLWRDETKRRKAAMGLKDPSSSPFSAEVLVSVSADPRDTQAGGWIHEEEFREELHGIIREERTKSDGVKLSYGNFLKRTPFESGVRTAFQSVEDLFEENLARAQELMHQARQVGNHSRQRTLEIPQVDEERILSFADEEGGFGLDGESPDDANSPRLHDNGQIASRSDIVDIHSAGINKTTDNAGPEEATSYHLEEVPVKSKAKRATAELQRMGVRDVSRPLCPDDAFVMDEDFLSNLKTERKTVTSTDSGPHPKKRKVGNERPENVEAANISIQMKLNDHRYSVAMLDPGEKPSRVASPTVQVKDGDLDARRNNNGVSQERSPVSSVNGRLPFPVVKIQGDPRTSKKLSQSSDGSFKESQRTKTKSPSIEKSTGPKLPSAGPRSYPTPSSSHSSKPSPQGFRYCAHFRAAFDIRDETTLLVIAQKPISASDCTSDLMRSKHPTVLHQDAFYSRETDVPERAREYAGKEFKLKSATVSYLPDFDPIGTSPATVGRRPGIVIDRDGEEAAYEHRKLACSLRTWEFRDRPPSGLEVLRWTKNEGRVTRTDNLPVKANVSQIDYSTQKNKHGFKYSQKQKSTSVKHETQYMSIMSLEVHVDTRNSFVPNPEQDEICCIFWCLRTNANEDMKSGSNDDMRVGLVVLSDDAGLTQRIAKQTSVEVEGETSELDVITRMVDVVRHWDPDILTGFEVHGGSWGYLIERARFKYDYNLCDEFSRVKSDAHGRFGKEEDRWGFNHTSTIRVTGRHMINIWRAMRGELNLLQYTMENVVFQLCHRRIPHYSFSELTAWYRSGKARDLAKVIDHYVSRVQLDLEILDQNELVPRTSEQARLLGVDFFSVFSRGSQFKVESLMFRIAKPENLLLPSPSRKQVGQQNALECLPLVMEPQSSFFPSPLLVLDFQSLYPSVMIAYNYCYSTCLGRVVSWRGQNKMGFKDYHRQPRLLELLQDHINIAPNGIMYARPNVRQSLLAKMLSEILETRVMVKSGMKTDKDDKTLQRLLNNRQLALKLIANVTYGYTSASFSGRMPCSEIADSIVQTGRETLEKAIALIHSVERWSAEVVYGDTDSLFVYLKGRTKDEAFDIGQEIAKTITKMNPRPIKLKFEKVYFPCVLLAKKRYVGFKYETRDQTKPDFDAKGIETVRRDGTPAAQKIEEKALKIFFRTADLSQVKQYFQGQCEKIMRGRVSIQDFCFAKEVKLGTYSDKGPPPPGALISTKKMLEDPRAEPQYGERVPYVVIAGGPGARLIDRCVAPEVVLHDANIELDSEYYIGKHLIPPLERIFNLVGANVRQWYDEMPKFQRIRRVDATALNQNKDQGVSKKTLESYMKSSSCLVCREKVEDETGICARCAANAEKSLFLVQSRLSKDEAKTSKLVHICRSCANMAWGEDVRCDSKDCPVFYTRSRQQARLRNTLAMAMSVRQKFKDFSCPRLNW